MDISGFNSNYLNYITNSAETGNAEKLKKSAETDYSKASDDELMSVCKEFEAYFLEQMLKEVKKTVPDTSGATGANKNLIDFYTDNMIQTLAEQSTENNSLGLAQTLYTQMKRNLGEEA